MLHEFQVKMLEVVEKIKFYIGNVRGLQSCRNAMPLIAKIVVSKPFIFGCI